MVENWPLETPKVNQSCTLRFQRRQLPFSKIDSHGRASDRVLLGGVLFVVACSALISQVDIMDHTCRNERRESLSQTQWDGFPTEEVLCYEKKGGRKILSGKQKQWLG